MAKKNKHQKMADEIITALKDGTAPWIKPWTPDNSAVPHNPVTGTRYRGINHIYLSMQDVDDPRWVTFKQAQKKGWQVKRGSKGTTVQFWQFEKDEKVRSENGEMAIKRVKLERPLLRHYYVFNASQIDGIPPLEPSKQSEWDRHDRAENLLKESGADIQHVKGDKAAYSPGLDAIRMPERGQFDTPDKYYATALHELGHWTGHESRLNRKLGNVFGSEDYAREELRAEIASYMLGMELGIGHDPGQHLAYVDSWIKALEDHPTEIFRACADAEKIQSFILNFEQERDQNKDVETSKEAEPMHQTEQIKGQGRFVSFIGEFDVKFENQTETKPQAKKQDSAGVIRLDNPLWVDQANRSKDDLIHALDKGHDGLVYTDKDKAVAVIATSIKQIHKNMYYATKGLDGDALRVPYADKNRAKEYGAAWNGQTWIIPNGLNAKSRAYLNKWLPNQSRTADNPQQQFADFIRDMGGDLRGEMPVMDGKIHRIPEAGAKKGNKNIAYAGYMDGIPAGWVKNWRGEQKNWKAKGIALTNQDRAKLKKESAEKQARREKERKELHSKTAKESEVFTRDLPAATGKEKYFTDKNLNLTATGAKTDKKGNIILPMKDVGGKQWSHLTLHPNGFKQILKDSRLQGTFALVGAKNLNEIKGDLNLAEGYSTAATIHEATGEPVLVTGTGNNLKHVARALRDRHPERNIFVLADDDKYLAEQGKMNTGRVQGREAAKAVNGHVVYPDFAGAKANKERTDFRDMAKMRGKTAVADYITAQKDLARAKQRKKQEQEQESDKSSHKVEPALER